MATTHSDDYSPRLRLVLQFSSSWVDMPLKVKMQQLRIGNTPEKMVKFPARSSYNSDKEYYGTLAITGEYITFTPDDPERDVFVFDESRLNDCIETSPKGIQLNQRYKKSGCHLTFKTIQQRDRALTAIHSLTSDKSTDSECANENAADEGQAGAGTSRRN